MTVSITSTVYNCIVTGKTQERDRLFNRCAQVNIMTKRSRDTNNATAGAMNNNR